MYINILPYFTPTRTGGCPKNCSGQGDCSGDICTCHPGYRGKDCSGIICPNNCSQNGNCVNDQCQCFQDFKGQYYSQSGHLTNKINHDWFVKVTLSLSVSLSFSLFFSHRDIILLELINTFSCRILLTIKPNNEQPKQRHSFVCLVDAR